MIEVYIKKRAQLSSENYLTYGLIILLIALIVATILLGSVPPVDRDALTHHLFVPKLYLQHSSIYEIPEIPFSYYPMNLDLLYMIPLYFSNDIAPKYIHYFFALLTAVLIYRYLRKSLGRNYGLFGAIFFLSIPIIIKLSITVYVDLGVVFFTTASLLLLLHWAKKDFQIRFLILSGLCCGLAAGTKYNALISIFTLTLLVPLIYQQSITKENQSNFKAFFYGILFLSITLVACSPWLIRNYSWTGNPIFPLHNSYFQKSEATDQDVQTDDDGVISGALQKFTSKGSNALISRKILYNEPLWQALLLPVRFFYEGQDDNPQFFDGKLTPFLLFLPIMAFLIKSSGSQQHIEKKFLLIFAFLYFFLTFFQESLRIRYIVPIVPPLVILSMFGLQLIYKVLFSRMASENRQKSIIFFWATCIPGIMLWYNTHYLFSQFTIVKPLPYIRGEMTRDQYISFFRPEYPAIQFANTVLTPNTKVLCIFLGNRGYYMNFQPVFERPGESGFIAASFNNKVCGQDIIAELIKNNIFHVLMRDDLTATWFMQLDNKGKECITPLLNMATRPLFSQNGHTFFRVKE